MNIDLEDALASLEDARYEDQDELVANALFKVGEAYLQRRRLEEAFEALDEAEHYCRQMDNQDGLAQVNLRLARLQLMRGYHDSGLKRVDAALAHFTAQKEEPRRLSALELKYQLLASAGSLEEAALCLEEALAMVEDAGDDVGRILFGQYLAALLRQLGRQDEALAHYRQVGLLAHKLGDYQRVALASVGVGTITAEKGDEKLSRAAFGQAREIFESLGQLKRAGQVQAEMERLLAPGAQAI